MEKNILFFKVILILVIIQPKAFSQETVFPEDSWGVYSWTKFTQVDKNNAPLIKGGPLITRWVDIEPQDGVYKFKTEIDDKLQKALDNDWYTFINIWVAGPSASGWTPEWLYGKGIPKVQCERGAFPYYFHNYVPGQPPVEDSYQYYYFRLLNAIAEHILSLPENLRERVVFIQCAEGSTGDGYCYKGDVKSGYEQYEISREDWNVFRLDAWKEFKAAYSIDSKLQIPLLTNDDANNVELRQWMLEELDAIGVKQGMFSHGYQISDAQERVAAHFDFKQQAEAAGKVFFARGEMDGELHEFGWITQNKAQGLYWSAIYATHCGLNHWNMPQNDCKLSIHNNAFNFFNKYASEYNSESADKAFCAFYRGLDASDTEEFPVGTYGTASKSNQQRYIDICNTYSAYGANMADPNAATGGGMKNRSATGYNDAGWKILKTNFQRHITQIDAEETSAAWWQVDTSIYGRFARGFEPSSNKNAMYFDIDDNFFPDNQTDAKSDIKLKVIYRDADAGSWSLKYHATDGTMKTAFSVTNSGSGWKSKEILIEDALLNNGGDRGADLILQNDGGTNCRFHMVELAKNVPDQTTSDVLIEPNSVELTIGNSTQLTAKDVPSGQVNTNVIWSIEPEGIATVSSSGLVTGVSEGNATVTVSTNDGGFTDSCVVTVNNPSNPCENRLKNGDFSISDENGANYAWSFQLNSSNGADADFSISNNQGVIAITTSGVSAAQMKLKQFVDFTAGHNYTVTFNYKSSSSVPTTNGIRYFHKASDDSKAIGQYEEVTMAEKQYSFNWTQTITETIEINIQTGLCSPGNLTITDVKIIDDCSGLSVDKPKLELVKLYPNPVNNGLLNISTRVKIYKFQVFDLTGKMVHQELNLDTNATLDLSKLYRGLYIIRFESSQGNESKKIIIE
jgi:uncharacterized protein YjdB